MTQSCNFKIRDAILADAGACAIIHQREIHTGFLSQLGIRFLKLLYTGMICSDRVLCLVVEDENGQVVGFVSGSSHVGRFYKEFFVKRGLQAFLILLPKMVKPGTIKKILETTKYKSDGDLSQIPKAELLAIAVDRSVRGTGVACDLTEALFKGCRDMEIQEIKVVVGAQNIPANKFYKKMGFELRSYIFIHDSEKSNVYVKAF